LFSEGSNVARDTHMDSLGKYLLKNSSRIKNKIFWKSLGAKGCPNSI